jgi:hypothetical protein
LPALSILTGFFFAAPIYVLLFLRRLAGTSWRMSLFLALGLAAFLALMNEVLQAKYATGLLQELITLPPPFGS